MTKVEHTLEPLFDEKSKVLILGSMPSITSRRVAKYYGHPSNRFWPIMEKIYGETITDWQEFILKHHLALWDVIASCDITSSSDASIKNVIVNDIPSIIAQSKIEHIFLLGKSAFNLYNKHLLELTGIEGIYLPSPSPANASKRLDDLVEDYKIIKEVSK